MTNNLPQIICAGHICNCHNLTYLDWVCPFLVHTHISLTFCWRCRFGTLYTLPPAAAFRSREADTIKNMKNSGPSKIPE